MHAHRPPGWPSLCTAAAALALGACAADPDNVGVFDSNGATDGVTSSGSATASGSGGSATASGSGGTGTASGGGTDSDSGGSTGGIKYDVGGAGDATATAGDGTMGCEKIDFLFVVDNSGSMGAHQTTLVNSFPAFMDTIFSTVQAQDYHIMVIDSDAGEDLSSCPTFCGGNTVGSLGLDMACESAMGAGEVAPLNNQASNMDCGLPAGQRYLTSDLPQQEIKDKFACMAKVGTFGSGGEKPVSAAVEAITTQKDMCNAGFLRDDAVLVVTFITDDYPVDGTADDAGTFGDIQQWHDTIVGAKNNDPTHVVMLGVINLENSTCVQDGSAGGPVVHPTQKFVDFVNLFGSQGITGDICETPDFSGFFQQAVGLIDKACDDFVPPG